MPSQPQHRSHQRGHVPAWVAFFMVAGLVFGSGMLMPAHAGVTVPTVEVILEKLVNGDPADTAPGPTVTAGDPVTFTYVVTPLLAGLEFQITNVVLFDSDPFVTPTLLFGDDNNNSLLDFTEVWTFTGSATALPIQYQNIATFTGIALDLQGNELNFVVATDVGHYCGREPNCESPNGSVPEPSTVLLLGAAFVGLGYFRRSRR